MCLITELLFNKHLLKIDDAYVQYYYECLSAQCNGTQWAVA